MNNIEKLEKAFGLLKEVVDSTGVNLLDNYGYREYTTLDIVRQHLPSIKKVPGRTGDDANAIIEGYNHIEFKSGTCKIQTLSLSAFPKMIFDKQDDSVRRTEILNYDGLCLSLFEYYNPVPVVVVFVPKNSVSKLKNLIIAKQDNAIKLFESKRNNNERIGRDSIDISIIEILSLVERSDLICWLSCKIIDSDKFFKMIENKEIKINKKKVTH